MSSFRKERVADLIQSSVAMGLRELHDDRLRAVTLTGVIMSPDLKIAKIYYSLLPTQPPVTEKGSQEALKGAKNLLKKKVATELKLRFTPDLHFYFDESVETGSKIDALLNSIKKGEQA